MENKGFVSFPRVLIYKRVCLHDEMVKVMDCGIISGGCPHDVMVKVMDCGIVVSEFEP